MSIEKDKNEITIVGEGVDPVRLTERLRKKMCLHAIIVTVGSAEEEEKKKKKKDKPCMQLMYGQYPMPRYECYELDTYQNRDSCTLM